MQEVQNPFVEFIRLILAPLGLGDYAQVVALIPFLLVLYVVYLIIMRTITVSFRRVGMPQEATSGVRLIARLLFFAFGLTTVLSATTLVSDTAILTGGALFGTAIGLAFSRALSNMVSGFYVLGARPFRVGDYVRIGGAEGIVSELTLNYTRLILPDLTRQVVPNSKVVDSEVTNFRIRVDELMHDRGAEYHRETERSRLRSALGGLRDLAKGLEVYRYSFDISVHKDYSFKKVLAYVDDVIERHADNFLEKPEIMFWSNANLGNTFRLAYIVKKPEDILTIGANFQADVSDFHEAMKTA